VVSTDTKKQPTFSVETGDYIMCCAYKNVGKEAKIVAITKVVLNIMKQNGR
jgi:hypothetical protein